MNLENMDLVSKYFEERQMVAVPKSLFGWINSMKEDTFDQVTDALVYFSNELEENNDRSIVFNVVGNEPKYFRFLASQGEITFDDTPPEEIVAVELLEQIDIDEFLDEVLAGNQIIKDKNLKRFIASYELI